MFGRLQFKLCKIVVMPLMRIGLVPFNPINLVRDIVTLNIFIIRLELPLLIGL